MQGAKLSNNSKIKSRDFKLNLLLQITKAINENMSVQNLLTLFEDILRNKLKIGKAVLFRNDNQWKCLFHYSLDGKSQVVDFPEGLLIIRDIGTIPVHTPELKSEFEIVVPVYHKEKPLAFLLLGDIDESLLQLSTAIKHLPFVQTLTNIIIVARSEEHTSELQSH